MELQYKHIEAALAEVMQVKPKSLPALRARLRHLRNIGLPILPKTGSGRPIQYSRHHALEMLIAIELEKVGQAAKNAAMLAASIVRQTPYGQHRGKDSYVIIGEGKHGYVLAIGRRQFMQAMRLAPETFLSINVSACVTKLDAALNRAVA
jgi:hypothetical protein